MKKVKIFVSGNIDERTIGELSDLVDGFGIGASVSAAPPVDFSAKIVAIEKDGKMAPMAKRGDIGGAKAVYRNSRTYVDLVTPRGEEPDSGKLKPLLHDLIVDGRIVRKLEDSKTIRDKVREKLERVRKTQPRIVYRV
jgi:nicotinate phosphoribosyltransferase